MGKVIYLSVRRKLDKIMNIFEIANVFLNMESMTNKKLQKLCYYAQAWHLAIYEKPIVDTRFEAWIHGPVCPELYHYYKPFGGIPIPKKDLEDNKYEDFTLDFMKKIYELYGKMSGDDLEFLTHKELPWVKAREGLKDWQSSNNIIDNDIMRTYYQSLIKR